MNGFRHNFITLAAAAMLVISAAIAIPAFAHDGGDDHGSEQGTGSDHGEHSKGDDHSGSGGGDTGGRQEQDNSGKGGSDDPKLEDPKEPEQGKDMNAEPEHGVVTVRLPGSRKRLSLGKGASLPVGTVVDARHGSVTLTSAPDSAGHPQFATFSGAIFQVLQGHTGEVVTELRLRGRMLGICKQQARQSVFGRAFLPLAFASAQRRPVRKLWGSGKGHFRTRGRHGAATVRGTVWLTADYCAGTLVKVNRGLVGVRDFTRHKTVAVPAGHSYFARAPRAKRR